MVIYAAGTGQQALDRLNDQDKNPNGLFAREFIKASCQAMGEPGRYGASELVAIEEF